MKVIFFGPSEKAIASGGDKEFEAGGVKNLRDAGINVLACSRVAENNGIKDLLLQKSIPMEPVGPVIANYIKQGYAVMTF
ncbi:DsrE family protein [Thermogymnomonas acidicola]|uniref:DsrE family protein n=1 Tax=Thermogymnomonas acidicola TaxID=399579 RepID=UPI001494805D|nr:DsrE family protein [Thermogymnomonas acidicola]